MMFEWDKTIEPWWSRYVFNDNMWPHWEVRYPITRWPNDGRTITWRGKMDDQPQAKLDTALDDTPRRALVLVLRALREASNYIDDGSADFEVAFAHASEALTIAKFVWPEAFAEATRSEDGE